MRTFLILSLVFSALLLVPTFGAVYGGIIIPTAATTTWVGTGDGQSWSDPLNWDRQFEVAPRTIGFNHMLPELCDLVIIDDGIGAVTVHFDLPLEEFQLGNEMEIGADDTLVIDNGRVFNHTPVSCEPLNFFAETIVNNGNLNVFGILINNGNFINNGAVLDCGIITGTDLPLPGIVNRCTVGGELIPLDTSALILAGAQMNSAWMIPVIVSAIGIGIVIARKF
jgi:hypothetical protein